MKIKTFIYGLVFLVALCACSGQQQSVSYQLNGQTMGTAYNITIVGEHTIDPVLITSMLESIENSMSTYRPDSELMQLNRAPLNTWISISADLYEVLVTSQAISILSEGAFDITVGPLVNLWGFGPEAILQGSVPHAADIHALLTDTGYQYLELADNEHAVKKNRDIKIDLSAIAKGHAVDMLAGLLAAQDVTDFLVEIGGEIRFSGLNADREPWRIAIESPQFPQVRISQRVIRASNLSIASSGDYRNFYEVDGIRYSHTLDPRSGYPVSHDLVSVTVLADSTARADALATALHVLGTERALRLADQNNIPVYLQEKTENGLTERYSSAFAPYIN